MSPLGYTEGFGDRQLLERQLEEPTRQAWTERYHDALADRKWALEQAVAISPEGCTNLQAILDADAILEWLYKRSEAPKE